MKRIPIPDFIKKNYVLLEIILIPLLLSPLPIVVANKQAYCGYILIIMSIYWVLECLPLSITAFLPIILFPMFGILNSNCTSRIYFQDIQMLFYGALVVALGIEITGLHERIALTIIMIFGSDPKWLLLGVMSVTGFLSLWIQNTSAASMMLPIVVALCKQLIKYNKSFQNPKSEEQDSESEDVEENFDMKKLSPAAQKLVKGFCLGVAYSASVGGAGSLVGTTPNLVMKGYFDRKYPDAGVNFASYLGFSAPVAAIVVFLSWIALTVIWLPRKDLFKIDCKRNNGTQDPLQQMVRKRYRDLGPITWAQASMGLWFLFLIVLWLTRDLFAVPGWEILFRETIGEKTFTYVSDTTPTMFIVLFMFVWPKENIFKGKPYSHMISWKDMAKRFPWDVIILGGGSLAIADGFTKSGLSESIGDLLKNVIPPQKEISLVIILIFASFGTEFTSNTSMASILIPIADSIAVANGVKPIYFLLPLTVSVSLAFLFPVATPPNALVYGSGLVKIPDMLKAGLVLKFLGLLVVFMAANVWLDPIFPKDSSSIDITNPGGCPTCDCP